MNSRILGLCASLLVSVSSAAGAICSGGTLLADHAGKQIVLAQDTLFFATGSLELDHDGSPEAYGVWDQGVENICNGLGPLQPPACRGQTRGTCFVACKNAFATWSKAGADPKNLPNFMCSIGLGGGGCSTPQVRLQDPPRQDWFVSETAVRVSPPATFSGTGWTASQPAQLDAAQIPYFVIPGKFRAQPWDATPGDAGIVVDAKNNRVAAFVVGDTGGALNEASTALHSALRGGSPPPKGPRTSALGQAVESYLGGTSGDFRIAIFRHTSTRLPGTHTLALTREALPQWIETTAKARLSNIGGPMRVVACSK